MNSAASCCIFLLPELFVTGDTELQQVQLGHRMALPLMWSYREAQQSSWGTQSLKVPLANLAELICWSSELKS